MGRLGRYIFRDLLSITLGLVLIVTFTIWVMRSLRLIEVMIASGVPITILGQALMLALPSTLGIVAPVSLGGAVVFCYYKLLTDSEIVAMQSAGCSAWRLAQPALVLSGLMTVSVLLLNLYGSPAARQALAGLRVSLRDIAPLLHENTFTEITDGVTIYLRRRFPSGTMSGILIHDSRQQGEEVTLLAERGAVIEQGNFVKLVMENGVRQQREASGRFSELYFDRYASELALPETKLTNRFRRTWERSSAELLDPPAEIMGSPHQLRHFRAELHMRLASPFLAITFVLTALACLLSPRGGRRRYHWQVVAALGSIALLQGASFGLSHLAFDDLIFAAGLYSLHVLAISLALWKLSRC